MIADVFLTWVEQVNLPVRRICLRRVQWMTQLATYLGQPSLVRCVFTLTPWVGRHQCLAQHSHISASDLANHLRNDGCCCIGPGHGVSLLWRWLIRVPDEQGAQIGLLLDCFDRHMKSSPPKRYSQ
ncbi:hypothetical protein PCPL58_p4053 (plasmid) [Pseudomonas cerasi]|nr:hypothetical protein PCPL58_p4053 [Pseudomonas cerasi]